MSSFIFPCSSRKRHLLAVAGLSPLSYLPGLLFNLCLISGIVILPLVAIAAVTSNFARMTLVLLGILLSTAAFTALAVRINLASMTLPWETGVDLAVLICFCCAAIVSQYFTRNTRASVLLLFAVPGLCFFVDQFIAPPRSWSNFPIRFLLPQPPRLPSSLTPRPESPGSIILFLLPRGCPAKYPSKSRSRFPASPTAPSSSPMR